MSFREEVKESFRGPSTLIPMPFNKDGSIDYKGLKNYIDFVINAGVGALMLTMGDSLYTTLTDDEVAEVTKRTAEFINNRVLFVASDRVWWTGKEVEFAKYCKELGIKMLMVTPPDWAASCTIDTLVEHYNEISKHINIMFVTNYLIDRGMDQGIEILKAMKEKVPGILAVKDDFGGAFGKRLALLNEGHWSLTISGAVEPGTYLYSKESFLEVWPYGYEGYISSHINFAPKVTHMFWDAIKKSDSAEAARIIKKYEISFSRFTGSLNAGGVSGATLAGGDAIYHGTMELFGIFKRWRRKPYYSLGDEEMEILKEYFKDLRLL
jgi:4-hydroxy-tetrahydrodipicolinate synthase